MTYAYLAAALAFLGGYLTSWAGTIRGLLFISVQIEPRQAHGFFKHYHAEPKRLLFTFATTVGNNRQAPASESVLIVCRGMLIWFACQEQLLQAGYDSKQQEIALTTFRWDLDRLRAMAEEFCRPEPRKPYLYLNSCSSWQSYAPVPPPPANYILPGQARLFLAGCQRVLDGEIDKTGAVLCGPPGNGKSSLVKYLCQRFGLDLMAVNLERNSDSNDILTLFLESVEHEQPALILFEDFDTVFDGRKPTHDVAYTFDVILNALDGPYLAHRRRIFVLTTNRLEAIDPALRRPGRFDHCLTFDPPTEQEIRSLLPDAGSDLIEDLRGMSYAELGAIGKLPLTRDNVAAMRQTGGHPSTVV